MRSHLLHGLHRAGASVVGLYFSLRTPGVGAEELQALFAERWRLRPSTKGRRAATSFSGREATEDYWSPILVPPFIGGPNGIRMVMGLDLTFSIRGVAIRH